MLHGNGTDENGAAMPVELNWRGAGYPDSLIDELLRPAPCFQPVTRTEAELRAMSGAELRALVREVRRERHRVASAANMLVEGSTELEQPQYEANFEVWRRKPYWTIEEAAALLCGLDPDAVTLESMKPYASNTMLGRTFVEIVDCARRAVEVGDLRRPDRPLKFVQWAKEQGFSVPEEIEPAVRERDNQGVEGQTAGGNTELELAQERIAALEAKLAEAVAERDRLHRDLQNEGVNEKERTSLYTLALGLVHIYYGSYQGQIKTAQHMEILKDLHEAGFKTIVSDDTVQKHLQAAAGKLD